MKRLLLAPLPLLVGCSCGDESPRDASFYVSIPDMGVDLGGWCGYLCVYHEPYAGKILSCEIDRVDAGVGFEKCTYTPECVGGRRPAELVRAGVDGSLVGKWFAEAAQLEAASVPAFEILARELSAHDAPAALVERALASAQDERRHARIMTSLAHIHGVRPGPVRVLVRDPRDLESIARENAVEGLVREAYGARVAIDPAIGADERRHAALAADVHAWIRPRLPYAARLRVDEARDAARAALLVEVAVEPSRPLRDLLGLPDAARAVEIARQV